MLVSVSLAPPAPNGRPGGAWLREQAVLPQPLQRAVEGIDDEVDVRVAHGAIQQGDGGAPVVVDAIQQHRQMELGAEGPHAAIEARLVEGPVVEAQLLSVGAEEDAGERRDAVGAAPDAARLEGDRKSTRLNSSHLGISYAVF